MRGEISDSQNCPQRLGNFVIQGSFSMAIEGEDAVLFDNYSLLYTVL